MQLLFQIVNVDFIAFVTIIYLIIFMRVNDAYEHSIHKLFTYSLTLLVCLAISDNIDYYFSWKPDPYFIRKLAIMAGYILRVYLLMSSVFILMRNSLTRRCKILLFIPASLNALVILSAFFTDKIFYLDQNNVLHRQALSFSPHVLSLVYFFVVLGIAGRRYSRGYKEEGKMLFVSLVSVMIGVMAEIILKTRGIFISAVSLMLTFYYLYLHIEHFKRDTLTGVLNRMSFFADVKKFKNENITALCEFDMNNLKWINDTRGHAQGDKAIISVSNIIQDSLPNRSYLYRMGGDEFLALFCNTDIQTVCFILEKIRADFSKTEYSCAIGMAEWDANKEVQDIYNLADERMYEDKKRLRALGIARTR